MKKGVFIRIRKSRTTKYITMFCLVSFLNSLWIPKRAKADGPVQPEFTGFQQVDATQMVDPFTGDFSYNIHLLTVPGPDGGYPINLTYNAGITMDQEASWVGLGWNLNVGGITRQMRGMPDDFDGTQKLKKELHTKPNWSIGFDFLEMTKKNIEFHENVLGLNFESISSSQTWGPVITYDNYSGLGLGYSIDYAFSPKLTEKSKGQIIQGFSVLAGIDYDRNTGVNANAGVGACFSDYQDAFGLSQSMGISYNSREAALNRNFNVYFGYSGGNVRTNYAPLISIPFKSSSHGFQFRYGEGVGTGYTENTYKGYYNKSQVENTSMEFPVYGYLFSDYSSNGVGDYSINRKYPFSSEMKALSVPFATYDLYQANAQGLSSSFRPQLSYVPAFSPTTFYSNDNDIDGGAESTSPNGTQHYGIDGQVIKTENYTGPWRTGNQVILNYLAESPVNRSFEKYYYKSIDDIVPENGNDDVRFNINEIITPPIAADGRNTIMPESNVFQDETNLRKNRDLRSESIEYFKNAEAATLLKVKYFTTLNKFPYDGTSYQANYSYTSHTSSEIGAYSVLNESGMRYEFGLPVYTSQTEYAFSIDKQTDQSLENHTVAYSPTDDASENNKNGKDHFYSKSEMPQYATQYLLTAVYSPDYVDLTGDGPSEDDLGSYTKFNYTKTSSDFGQRYPYYNANYQPGYYSDTEDDKASFAYYQREQYFLNSVETKTHIAVFTLEERTDAYGTIEHQSPTISTDKKSYSLKKIDLYCKTDPRYTANQSQTPRVPMRTVHFEYDKSLCAGAPGTVPDSKGGGKLTLKKVWFSYQGNEKGSLSPYQFSYASNPNYSAINTDKWGCYKSNTSLCAFLNDPYVSQKTSNEIIRSTNASAWNLSQIELPSGGKIDIEYEMDDYAYVQNKPAEHMARIVGVGDNEGMDEDWKLSNTKNRVFFELEDATLPDGVLSAQLAKAFSDNNLIYFKTYMYLKTSSNDKVDYVSGYAKVISSGIITINGVKRGYVDLDPVPVGKGAASLDKVHPFTKATWQYMYSGRPDVLYPTQGDDMAMFNVITNTFTMIREHLQMLMGYYNFCYINQYSRKIDHTDQETYPSFVRIPDLDGCMYGGGHRVKKITTYDSWDVQSGATQPQGAYTINYSYKLKDGRSSGVATYEPLTGADENALRTLKDKYNGNNRYEYQMYNIETPMCEDYYPSPSVGYSNVTISSKPFLTESMDDSNFKKTGTGYSVYEFYTAKDFPVIEEAGTLQERPHYHKIVPKLFKFKIYNICGFTQGYRVFTNDMHGKIKSVSSYKENEKTTGVDPVLVSREEYFYKTLSPYNSQTVNRLNNTCKMIMPNGSEKNMEMGVTRDFFFEWVESQVDKNNVGVQSGLSQMGLWWLPSAYPLIFGSKLQTKTLTSMKVIHQTGILERIVTSNDTKKAYKDLLGYDMATGQAIWSKNNNEFNNAVFEYVFPAHWSYSGMGLASSNYRYNLNAVAVDANGNMVLTPADCAFLEPGDQLLSENNNYWVDNVDQGLGIAHIINASGNNHGSGTGINFTLIRSGRRNMLSSTSGVEKYIGNRSDLYAFGMYLNLITRAINENNLKIQLRDFTYPNATSFTYDLILDCEGGKITTDITGSQETNKHLWISLSRNGNIFNIQIKDHPSTNPDNHIFNYTVAEFTGDIQFDLTGISLYNLIDTKVSRLYVSGGTAFSQSSIIEIDLLEPNGNVIYLTSNGLVSSCKDKLVCNQGILHSEASEYSDNLERVYAELGVPSTLENNAANNPWLFGKKGRWNAINGNAYYSNRKQGTPQTNIAEDGTYVHYNPFNWISGNNPEWWKVNEITLWNVDGRPLETKDKLGIYSALLYSHPSLNPALVAAAASNCRYQELAYDGFEEHGTSYSSVGRGHLIFKIGSNDPTLSNADAHTGRYSVLLPASTTMNYTYAYPQDGKFKGSFAPLNSTATISRKYVASAWVKMNGTPTNSLTMTVSSGGTSLGSVSVTNTGQKVDGWKKVYLEFTMPQTLSGNFVLNISGGNNSTYVDDIRIHPFNSTVVTAVYDRNTQRLMAELDDNNYATYYSYTISGDLFQIKKETESGKQTVKTSWMNVKQ